MFALMAWTSLIIHLGMREPLYLVRADTLLLCIEALMYLAQRVPISAFALML